MSTERLSGGSYPVSERATTWRFFPLELMLLRLDRSGKPCRCRSAVRDRPQQVEERVDFANVQVGHCRCCAREPSGAPGPASSISAPEREVGAWPSPLLVALEQRLSERDAVVLLKAGD